MNRRTTIAMTTTALFCSAVGLSTSASLAQQQPLKGQLIGTWTLVSSDQVRPDGTRLKKFGANPTGINVFDANGRFFIMIASADNSQIASNDPRGTNSEESGALIVESIAYYGTYTVNEADRFIMLHLDASTFPNQIGTDQKRIVTILTPNELKYSIPAAISDVPIYQVWMRAN
jgi:Lipocalin-like domain